MPSYKNVRMDKLDKEIDELIKGSQEGSEVDPTQSTEVAKGESSSEVAEVITEQEVVQPTEIKAEEDTLEYWKGRALTAEQRYNVSKPKYDSNIYQLKQENLQLQRDRVELQKSLNQLRQATSKKEDTLDELFDKQTVDVLGQKTADAIKNSIKETNARVDKQEESAADAKVAADEAKIQSQINSDYDTFIADLTRMVPDQAELNTDKLFHKYLEGVDEVSGKIRWDLLRQGQSVGQAKWVAQIFMDYKESLKEKKVTPVDSVNKRIAPTKDGATSVQDITNAGKVTMEFVDKFYNDITHGVYKGRYKEQMAIEAQIDKAFIEGNLI